MKEYQRRLQREKFAADEWWAIDGKVSSTLVKKDEM